jgi:hypothetical protein
LVPKGADFPGSVTPTLRLTVVGLHSDNPYKQPVRDYVKAVTGARCETGPRGTERQANP